MRKYPGEIEISGTYSMHLGGRLESAGLQVQFHYNQIPGLHFKTEVRDEYREWILTGLEEGLAERFPEFPDVGSIWINKVFDHEVNSSQNAFYKAARMVIDQAFAIANIEPPSDLQQSEIVKKEI